MALFTTDKSSISSSQSFFVMMGADSFYFIDLNTWLEDTWITAFFAAFFSWDNRFLTQVFLHLIKKLTLITSTKTYGELTLMELK